MEGIGTWVQRYGGVLFFGFVFSGRKPEGVGAGATIDRCLPCVAPHGWSHACGIGKPRPGSKGCCMDHLEIYT
jgi:hypothetical protein